MAVKEQIAQQNYAQQGNYPVNEYGVQLRAHLPSGQRQPYPPHVSNRSPLPLPPGTQSKYPPVRTSTGHKGKQRLTEDDAQVYMDDLLENDPRYYPQPSGTSAIVRRPQTPAPLPEKKHFHWLFWLGIGFSLMLVGWMAISALGEWLQARRDDFTYGTPRTFQADVTVGHFGRVSHVIALNLHGELEVIELQKGHPEASKIYVVVVLPSDQDSIVVWLTFQDMNGDGLLDMLFHYGAMDTEVPMYNTGTAFQMQPPQPKK